MCNFHTTLRNIKNSFFIRTTYALCLSCVLKWPNPFSDGMRNSQKTWLFLLWQGPESRNWLAPIFRTKFAEKHEEEEEECRLRYSGQSLQKHLRKKKNTVTCKAFSVSLKRNNICVKSSGYQAILFIRPSKH